LRRGLVGTNLFGKEGTDSGSYGSRGLGQARLRFSMGKGSCFVLCVQKLKGNRQRLEKKNQPRCRSLRKWEMGEKEGGQYKEEVTARCGSRGGTLESLLLVSSEMAFGEGEEKKDGDIRGRLERKGETRHEGRAASGRRAGKKRVWNRMCFEGEREHQRGSQFTRQRALGGEGDLIELAARIRGGRGGDEPPTALKPEGGET